MLFGEYLVLCGADCLAFPLKFGQTLKVTPTNDKLIWKSYATKKRWFEAELNEQFDVLETNNSEVASMLVKLLRVIKSEKPQLSFRQSFSAEADFDLQWGLGSSSTLISLLSQWSGVDAFKLLESTFGGSGYDVACATETSPIVYATGKVKEHVELPKSITNQLLFVYLGKKQNSRNEIKRFNRDTVSVKQIDEINKIITNAINAKEITTFELALNQSEKLIASLIDLKPIKQNHFSDYPYSVKSLGAWGGDFFMATYRDLERAKNYFHSKGYTTQFTYQELIK